MGGIVVTTGTAGLHGTVFRFFVIICLGRTERGHTSGVLVFGDEMKSDGRSSFQPRAVLFRRGLVWQEKRAESNSNLLTDPAKYADEFQAQRGVLRGELPPPSPTRSAAA